jgi:hypothetical protein
MDNEQLGRFNSHSDKRGWSFREEARVIRVRLTDEDLDLAKSIQDHHKELGLPGSLEFLISSAIRSYYDKLADDGELAPI